VQCWLLQHFRLLKLFVVFRGHKLHCWIRKLCHVFCGYLFRQSSCLVFFLRCRLIFYGSIFIVHRMWFGYLVVNVVFFLHQLWCWKVLCGYKRHQYCCVCVLRCWHLVQLWCLCMLLL